MSTDAPTVKTAGISVALFPLSTVLFPGGELSLRIFEQRYLDLVRDCTRENEGFGICLILDGHEPSEPATSAAIGTLAHIVDFYTLPDGLLGIRVQGGRRFRVERTRVRDNGLVHGEVHFLATTKVQPVPPEYLLLVTILERLFEKIDGAHAHVDRARLDDAEWVGFRLAELLPIENRERQHLLQLSDPLERLAQLVHYLSRLQSA